MSRIFLFRGKAATGKSTITNLLSKSLNVSVIRKDDVYDKLSLYNLEHSIKNSASYEILANMIQTNIDNECDVIVDISLAHNPYLMEFLYKFRLNGTQIVHFLCVCSDSEVWRQRIEDRLENPAPNQFFKSAQEAENYYSGFNIKPLANEVVLDSKEDILDILERIYDTLGIKDKQK